MGNATGCVPPADRTQNRLAYRAGCVSGTSAGIRVQDTHGRQPECTTTTQQLSAPQRGALRATRYEYALRATRYEYALRATRYEYALRGRRRRGVRSRMERGAIGARQLLAVGRPG
jgi:hypothetical protein